MFILDRRFISFISIKEIEKQINIVFFSKEEEIKDIQFN